MATANQKKILFATTLIIIFIVWAGVGLQNYLQFGQSTPIKTGEVVNLNLPSTTVTPSTQTTTNSNPSQAVEFEVEPFVSNLQVPWSMVFTSAERILVTERPGKVRVILNGQLQPQPIRVFAEVTSTAEEGLMGMTLDPNYQQNKYIYLCLAYETDDQEFDKVIRVKDQGDSLAEEFIVIDKIPAARFHAGCRLKFGPDDKLYISTGDATNKSNPQNLDSLGGKILRIDADGSIPSDNPFSNSAVYSYGHRNPQGFDWHPLTGALIATEHGPSGNDGPGGGDEVNYIQAKANYGWPDVSHDKTKPGTQQPLLVFTPAIAPASGMFYKGQVFPQLTNVFLVGMLRGEGILQVNFDSKISGQILSYQKMSGIDVGRVRDIVEGPDGLIYFTTSNQDGRGKVRAGDDHIYRLVPKN